jgi:hypothetical protein
MVKILVGTLTILTDIFPWFSSISPVKDRIVSRNRP